MTPIANINFSIILNSNTAKNDPQINDNLYLSKQIIGDTTNTND